MDTKIFIPKRIRVGFQERHDTYTKKLAYIIYYDAKNKIRKEPSWNSWRDKNIEPLEFDNVPTSGFVLNKKTGDYRSDFGHRMAHCRVYDPRGFEFEIEIDNLLFILENTNSYKGKGLEGEFVYGWNQSDLVLIPVDSPDYRDYAQFTNMILQPEKISSKSLIPGATYRTNRDKEWIYLGRFDYYEYLSYNKTVNEHRGLQFFFVDKLFINEYEKTGIVNQYYYEHIKSISGRIVQLDDPECHDLYANIMEDLEHRPFFSPVDLTKTVYLDLSFDEVKYLFYKEYYRKDFIIEFENQKYRVQLYRNDHLTGKVKLELPYYINVDQDYLRPLYYNEKRSHPDNGWTTLESLYNTYKFQKEIFYLHNGKEMYQ